MTLLRRLKAARRTGVVMTLPGIGLVSRVSTVPLARVTKVAAAIASQVTHQLCPAWNLPPIVVHAYPTLADVPKSYGVLLLMPDIASAFFGFHKTSDNRPVAFVGNGKTWSLFASHEIVEMAIDPDGTMFRSGPSPVAGQGTVDFLLEACDPVQDFAYPMDGQLVSDFCLPAFYRASPPAGAPLTQAKNLTVPFSVGPRGYITWRFGADFWQRDRLGLALNTQNLGPQNPVAGSFRAALDVLRPETASLSKSAHRPPIQRLMSKARRETESCTAYAHRFRREVDAFRTERRRSR